MWAVLHTRNCRECGRAFSICCGCDRGHVYGSDDCRAEARRKRRREASARHRRTAAGRENNARHQREHRERRRRVSDPSSGARANITDPYLPLIRETLDRYPRLHATRLYQMLCERGYRGSTVQLRRVVRAIRPRQVEAFTVLKALPGESAQADWADFGPVKIGRAERRLSFFCLRPTSRCCQSTREATAASTRNRTWETPPKWRLGSASGLRGRRGLEDA